jgi:hypothetical protein
MVTRNFALLAWLPAAGTMLLSACALFAPKAAPPEPAVVPAIEDNPEAQPLLEQAAVRFGKQHPHKLEPRLVWARGIGWDMIRHEVSGTIVARGVGMGMYVFDTSNSQCWLWVCDMYQQETGGQWGDPVIPLDTCLAPSQVTCDSMDGVIAQVQGGA